MGELRSSGYILNRGSSDIRNLNIHSESWTAIKAALTSGLYPNLARYSPVDGGIITKNETRSQFHFTSTLLVQEGRNNGLGFLAGSSQNSLSSTHPVSILIRSLKVYTLYLNKCNLKNSAAPKSSIKDISYCSDKPLGPFRRSAKSGTIHHNSLL